MADEWAYLNLKKMAPVSATGLDDLIDSLSFQQRCTPNQFLRLQFLSLTELSPNVQQNDESNEKQAEHKHSCRPTTNEDGRVRKVDVTSHKGLRWNTWVHENMSMNCLLHDVMRTFSSQEHHLCRSAGCHQMASHQSWDGGQQQLSSQSDPQLQACHHCLQAAW